MRVLRVIDSLDPRVGGPAVTSLNSAISVARTGIRCDIAVVVRPGDTETSWWRAIVDRCRNEGIGLAPCPVLAPRLSPHHYDPSAALVWRLLRRGRPRYDIVHADSPWTGACSLASLTATLVGARLVITPHEVFTPFDLSRGGLRMRVAKRAGARVYGRLADAIICSSPLEMRDAEAAGLPVAKLTWVYHPVVDDRAVVGTSPRPARESTGLRVGYLGRLHPKKNVSLLIDAVARLDRRASLLVAGRGDDDFERALHEQAKRLPPAQVEFAGWKSGDDKARFLTEVDVVVMPSDYECFGVAAVEAMAAGTPVIVSDRVGIAEIVRTGRAGQVVRVDVESIADALRRYLDDPEARNADASRARPAALAGTSFAAHGTRLASAYARIVEARTAE